MESLVSSVLKKKKTSLTVEEIQAECGGEKLAIRRAITALRKKGKVAGEKGRKGTKYYLTDIVAAPGWYYALHAIKNGVTSVDSMRYLLARNEHWCKKAVEYLFGKNYIREDDYGWLVLTPTGEKALDTPFSVDQTMMSRACQGGDRGMRTAACIFDAAIRRKRVIADAKTKSAGRSKQKKERRAAHNRIRPVHELRRLMGCKKLSDLDKLLGYSDSYMSGLVAGKGSFQNVLFRACLHLDMSPKELMGKIDMDPETVFF